MGKRILITGGAGFIGSHLADELLDHGYEVRAIDVLSPQVHGDEPERPAYLDSAVEFVHGDIRDADAVRSALENVDAVFHFAAAVGVGQSMYEIEHYTSVNNVGTAVLMEALIRRPVERLVVASSMSVYGEGLYSTPSGKVVPGHDRPLDQFRRAKWELTNGEEGFLKPLPTPEWKQPTLSSIYALSKYDQERMCLMTGRAYDFSAVALRFFNVYGTRQALSNPYTGVLAIFGSRYLNDQPPLIFEDGEQQRDFVHVYDVVRACRLALETPGAAGQVFNVGSGTPSSVRGIAERMGRVLGKEHIRPRITGKYRKGDIRHCFADISRARSVLGYEPQVSMDEGLAELAEWLDGQVAQDRVETASAELVERGLTV